MQIIYICNKPIIVVKYDVYIMESGGTNGISIKIITSFVKELQTIMDYELFQAKEGRILFGALAVLAIVLFIVDRGGKRKK